MNASTAHSPLLYKYAPCCFNVAAKASASKMQSAALDYKGDVGAYLPPSESEESSSDLTLTINWMIEVFLMLW
jgi:hypothetical protein